MFTTPFDFIGILLIPTLLLFLLGTLVYENYKIKKEEKEEERAFEEDMMRLYGGKSESLDDSD